MVARRPIIDNFYTCLEQFLMNLDCFESRGCSGLPWDNRTAVCCHVGHADFLHTHHHGCVRVDVGSDRSSTRRSEEDDE